MLSFIAINSKLSKVSRKVSNLREEIGLNKTINKVIEILREDTFKL